MLWPNPPQVEKQNGYNKKWGVAFNGIHGRAADIQRQKTKKYDYDRFNKEIEERFNNHRMTDSERAIRQKLVDYLAERLRPVYFTGHLICGGSTTSTCGTITSDMDLCFVVKTADAVQPGVLPIHKYAEANVNGYIIDRIHLALRPYQEIKNLETRPARVPIVKFDLNSSVVGDMDDRKFEFDINCNCTAGIYNSFLLGGLARFDERLPKMSIVLKEWAKNVKVVGDHRFNSYTIVLLIIHYLQCGVNPPILPNLMKLNPEIYDGTLDPWELSTEIDLNRLPERENDLSAAELIHGFFAYYSRFDFSEYGILLKEPCVVRMFDQCHGRIDSNSTCGSRIFVEEPYDGLTVPKNIKHPNDFNHIHNEFRRGLILMEKSGSLSLADLLGIVHNPRYVTSNYEIDELESIHKKNAN